MKSDYKNGDAIARKVDALVNEALKTLVPYAPGKPMEELERELGISDSIKLASNESSMGPSPRAVAAIAEALRGLHRYPDGSAYRLVHKIAARLGVGANGIVLGNGSNEIIELVVRGFMLPGDEAVFAHPSFAIYPLVVQAAGGLGVPVPLKDLTHDLPAMARAVTPRTKIVFVCNPNNPTGTAVRKDAFEAFLRDLPDGVLVAVDEAYFEYMDDPQRVDSLQYHDSGKILLTLRTFSKCYGLAGLRIGYGVGHPRLIDYLHRVRQPFNVNWLAQVGALAALDDDAHLRVSVENNREQLARIYKALDAMGVRYTRSQANFLLLHLPGGDGKAVYDRLLRRGVIVRPMDSYDLPGTIRVTVGTPEENTRFLAELGEVIQ
ncbi:MAG: histidinol-phosphate transaminase [Deltaproteobacteria bacterium]|nr:histidinol-phosphate transaminase [Deltaproteobacteria bacterium]